MDQSITISSMWSNGKNPTDCVRGPFNNLSLSRSSGSHLKDVIILDDYSSRLKESEYKQVEGNYLMDNIRTYNPRYGLGVPVVR